MLPKGAIQCYCLKCKLFPGEGEDKHAFRPGSLCSICTICEVNILTYIMLVTCYRIQPPYMYLPSPLPILALLQYLCSVPV